MKRGREYHGCGEEYNMEKRERGSKIICPIILRLLGRISSEEEGKKLKIKKRGWGRISSCRELYTPLYLTLVDLLIYLLYTNQFSFLIGRIIDLDEKDHNYKVHFYDFLSAILSSAVYTNWRGFRAVQALKMGRGG